MKWVLLIAALLCGCAGKKEVVNNHTPLAPYVQIAISLREDVGGLSKVRPFYEKLGFTPIEEGGEPVPYVLYTDGVIHLRVDECQFPSPRLDYYTADAPKQVQRLLDLDWQINTEKACARKVNVTNFLDPNSQQLAIIQRDHAPVPLPRQSHNLMGTFGELSVHTNNRDESIAFYEKLGFKAAKSEKPWPLALLTDGNTIVGLHQTNTFTRTTITYYSKDSVQRIAKLKSMGFTFINEQNNAAGQVANAQLTAPDGQTFFVFEK